MTLTDELTDLLKSEIAVVMGDGMAHLGNLSKFDRDILILENVFEAFSQEVDWVETASGVKGYMYWRRVNLPRVIIRTEMILRIWPWKPQDLTKRPKPKRGSPIGELRGKYNPNWKRKIVNFANCEKN